MLLTRKDNISKTKHGITTSSPGLSIDHILISSDVFDVFLI